MKTRKEAAQWLIKELQDGKVWRSPIPNKPVFRNDATKYAHHFGKVELRHFLDFLYGGPPKSSDEELTNANQYVPKQERSDSEK